MNEARRDELRRSLLEGYRATDGDKAEFLADKALSLLVERNEDARHDERLAALDMGGEAWLKTLHNR